MRSSARGDPTLQTNLKAIPDTAVPQGRNATKKRKTRARLLEAAFNVMAEAGIDAAKIKDITDRADVGFGTFYNYFESKDALAGEVLDCMIQDFGLRSAAATQGLVNSDPAVVAAVTIRLIIREAADAPIWRWWAMRPDLLVDRLRTGLAEFVETDIHNCIDAGLLQLSPDEVDHALQLACWMIVGGIHDIVTGARSLGSETFVAKFLVHAVGFDYETAARVSTVELPDFGPANIDWTFSLERN
jgi:AcrR family transcriptional regulator